MIQLPICTEVLSYPLPEDIQRAKLSGNFDFMLKLIDARLSSARVPENPFSPNKAKNIMMGFVVGFVLASAVVVLRTMLDDTYKSADDIRKYTGMVVLASIPLADAGEQPKEKNEFKRRTKRFADDVRRRVGGSSGRKA